MDTSWLNSLTSGAQSLTALGTAVNGDVTAATGWQSLIGLAGPSNPTAPKPAPNGTLPAAAGISGTLSKYAGVLVVGALSVVVLIVLAIKGR